MLHKSHKSRFETYRDDTVIEKSTQYAKWTVASLMADVEQIRDSNTQLVLERDFQEMGALLVNNLAAKLASLLFPSSRPFFKTTLSDDLISRAEAQGHQRNEISSALARMEMDACQQLFKNASYNQLVIAVKHLIVTGNVLLYRDSASKKTTAYGIQSFAVRRDGRGKLVDCILREYTYFAGLPPEMKQQLRIVNPGKYKKTEDEEHNLIVELYTRISRKMQKSGESGFEVSQEADIVPVGKPGYYPENQCPWQVPTWNLISGEHYGRGIVEDYAGGFAKLSDLSHALTLYEIESTKVVNLVASGSGTDVDALAAAETGEWVAGTPDTVRSHETGSTGKVQAIMADIEAVFGRLAKAFMYTGNVRNAERVTAYELRQDALEAENTLGGTYSSLAEGMQVPMAHVLMLEVNPGILQGIVTKDVVLDVMAGIPALGRSVDVQNLLSAAQEIQAIAPILVQLDKRIDPDKLHDLIYSGRSVDTSMLFKSQEQMEAQAEAEAEVAQGQQQVEQAASIAQQQENLSKLQVQQ